MTFFGVRFCVIGGEIENTIIWRHYDASWREKAPVERRGGTDMRWDLLFRWGALKRINQLLLRSSVGDEPISVPVLVSQGSADEIVLESMTDDLVELMCSLGTQVEYLKHPGEFHGSVRNSVSIH